MSSILKSARVNVGLQPADESQPPTELEAEMVPENVPKPMAEPDPEAMLEAARACAYQEGLALGRSEGLLHGQREVESAVTAAQVILAEVTRWQRDQLSQEAPNIVGLAVAIAERIVRRAIALDHDVVIRTLDEAVRQREAKDLVRIAVNPEEADTVRGYWERSHPALADVEISPDPSVEPGGCLLHSRSSLIDALVQTQLDVICRELQTQRP